MVKTPITKPHVFHDPMASADASGVSFLVAQQLFVFQMQRSALQRLARQIDAALKQAPAPVRKPKA